MSHGHGQASTTINHRLDPSQFADAMKLLNKLADGSGGDERLHTAILNSLQALNGKVQNMFEDLETKVAALKDASDSAEALLDGIKKKLDDAIAAGGMDAASKARLAAITSGIDKEKEDLAAAVVRNTPAETA